MSSFLVLSNISFMDIPPWVCLFTTWKNLDCFQGLETMNEHLCKGLAFLLIPGNGLDWLAIWYVYFYKKQLGDIAH